MRTKKIFWKIPCFLIITFLLFGGFPKIIEKKPQVSANIPPSKGPMEKAKTGSLIVYKTPRVTCINGLTSAACIFCGLGDYDELFLLPIWGGGSSLVKFLCVTSVTIPNTPKGQRPTFDVGRGVIGYFNSAIPGKNVTGVVDNQQNNLWVFNK